MRVLITLLAIALLQVGAAEAQIRPIPPALVRPPLVTPLPSPVSPPLSPAPEPSPPPARTPGVDSSGETLCSDEDALAGRCVVVSRLPRCPGPDPRCPRPNAVMTEGQSPQP